MVQGVVNNWGRWGSDDQLGALNLLTPEAVLKAAQLIKKGTIYSLSVPLEKNGPQYPAFHKTWKVVHFSSYHPDVHFADDVVTMETHSGTHIDGLGHVICDGKMYNDISGDQANSLGVWKAGIENVRSMVGRGVMLDVPAYRKVDHVGPVDMIPGEELDSVAASQGIRVEQGDIVLIRSGWYRMFYENRGEWEKSYPCPDGSLASWLEDKDVCALGSDTPSVELRTSTAKPNKPALHRHALRDLGIYLLENLDLEELSRDKVYEFMFIGAPLRLMNTTGSPWNPLAIV